MRRLLSISSLKNQKFLKRYTENDSKVGNLAMRLHKFFCLERTTIVQAQGASEDKKCAA